jgi:hypothetical protein
MLRFVLLSRRVLFRRPPLILLVCTLPVFQRKSTVIVMVSEDPNSRSRILAPFGWRNSRRNERLSPTHRSPHQHSGSVSRRRTKERGLKRRLKLRRELRATACRQAHVSSLERKVNRLEMTARETASAAEASAAAATAAAMSFAAAPATSAPATAASEVASEVPSDGMQAQVISLQHQVNRLKLEARATASASAAGTTTAPTEASSTAVSSAATSAAAPPPLKAPSRRGARPAPEMPPSDPDQPVARGTSPELLSTLVSMNQLQEDIAGRLKILEELHVDPTVPVATSNHDVPAEKRVKK